MTNEKTKQCKSKNCNNPVLDGKYCKFHKKKRKERKDKIMTVAAVPLILGVGVAIKKGSSLKQVPMITAKVIKVILKR